MPPLPAAYASAPRAAARPASATGFDVAVTIVGTELRRAVDAVRFPLDDVKARLPHNRILRAVTIHAILSRREPNAGELPDGGAAELRLGRLAAVLTLQAAWRGHLVRVKYYYVRTGNVSRLKTCGGASTRRGADFGSSESISPVSVLDADGSDKGDAASEGFAPARRPRGGKWDRDTASAAAEHAAARRSELDELAQLHLGLDYDLEYLRSHKRQRTARPSGGDPEIVGEYERRSKAASVIARAWRAAYFLAHGHPFLSTSRRRRFHNSAEHSLYDSKHEGDNAISGSNSGHKSFTLEAACCCILRAWRSLKDRRVFRLIKSFVREREALSSRELLRQINIKESALADSSVGLKVRLRLGGSRFPPRVYYKIFHQCSTVDLNAFAPRNYANPIEKAAGTKCYKRFENNGWRPFSMPLDEHKLYKDAVFLRTTSKPAVSFAPTPTLSKEEKIRVRKERKINWMKRMYGHYVGRCDDDKNHAPVKNNTDFEVEEENFLLDWSSALDFDAYLKDWQTIATTIASPVQLDGSYKKI